MECVIMSNSTRALSLCIAATLLAACGGGGSGSSGGSAVGTPTSTPTQTANLAVMVSDASSEDWATIGVKIMSIALIPQGGGSNITVYTAPSPMPVTNLVLLDQLDDLLGNTSVPLGNYSGAVLTLAANPGDILLTTASNPEAGFAAAGGVTIPADQIQVQHTHGATGSLTVPVTVNFDSPLVVSSTQNNALDLEFNLAHPAFLIGHVPMGGGPTLWALNFNGPLRRLPRYDLTRLVLRHMYGDVTAVASGTITVTKEFPTEPPSNPETAIAGSQSLQINADSVNGTIFYDLDAKTRTVADNFSAESSLAGRYVRIAARYQQDGTLVATRIYASDEFNNVWVSPEGHVLHVNTTSDMVTVENESGIGVPLLVDGNTQFFVREPYNPAIDSKSIGSGPAFLSSESLIRGFKVHATVVDPLATPLVAQNIEIETARYDGAISATSTTNFVYTRNFVDTTDDYVYTMNYIPGMTPNGKDFGGDAITGYKWWNFAYPTLLTDGTDAVNEFVAATGGGVNFGGTVGAVPSYGVSFSSWNDPAKQSGWAAYASILLPSRLPLGDVETGLVGGSFTMTAPGGAMPVTVAVSTTMGSATLVYQIDRTDGVVTVSPVDITTGDGLTQLTTGLAVGAPVKVYGIPQANSTLKAYVLAYFTGTMPTN
jgi:Domain of unknown function (DUF4382)/Domain of unknown function (DUF5666)